MPNDGQGLSDTTAILSKLPDGHFAKASAWRDRLTISSKVSDGFAGLTAFRPVSPSSTAQIHPKQPVPGAPRSPSSAPAPISPHPSRPSLAKTPVPHANQPVFTPKTPNSSNTLGSSATSINTSKASDPSVPISSPRHHPKNPNHSHH